ncbi:purine-nucleoside phosphorylase [Marinilongibacter aquaticus]|uniref:purine-nucleoside phosphorylase n=1 Tax=Marinilongibacter aquaticus TaxID=2975157 RepID=UPI0021BDB85D|nr:purine-nucleoside phosphorylase [Marinilongibacter aquaticus]UBM58394.1 purine-nucleoside phosphorylase [Marinilongibacter aquaticus]
MAAKQDYINEAIAFVKEQVGDFQPLVGIVLGTGLNGLLKEIEVEREILYADIPGFVEATVEFHPGKLVFGRLSGKPVVCMSGRFHYYEGHSMAQVVFPIRVMYKLGIKNLFISNAAGGMNPSFSESDLMIIQDHVALFLPENPLVGPHKEGDRFPDMSEPYDLNLIALAEQLSDRLGIENIKKGVYVSVSGPNLETRAEYRLLRMLGIDAVGMSTVPEVLMARQLNLPVFAISVITDMCIPETLKKAEIEHILAAAFKAEPQMTALFKAMVEKL